MPWCAGSPTKGKQNKNLNKGIQTRKQPIEHKLLHFFFAQRMFFFLHFNVLSTIRLARVPSRLRNKRKKLLDNVFQSKKQPLEHYILHYFSRSEGKFLTWRQFLKNLFRCFSLFSLNFSLNHFSLFSIFRYFQFFVIFQFLKNIFLLFFVTFR